MRRIGWVIILAITLAAGPALAGGDGGSSPFSGQKKAPAPGTDPGFDAVANFFAAFAQGENVFVAGFESVDWLNRNTGVDYRSNYKSYRALRSQLDSSKEKETASPKAAPNQAPNQAPVRDPDALPGLDY